MLQALSEEIHPNIINNSVAKKAANKKRILSLQTLLI